MKSPSLPRPYRIQSRYGIIRDADPILIQRFRDAGALFRTRVELLLSLEHHTSDSEADSTSAMLAALLEGKRRLNPIQK